jgi:hypothetical protein
MHQLRFGLSDSELIIDFLDAGNGLGHAFSQMLFRSTFNGAFERHIAAANTDLYLTSINCRMDR